MPYVGFYVFAPTYDFSNLASASSGIRIENDYMAWLGIMRRVNYMLNIDFDLSDLKDRSDELIRVVDSKIEEMDQNNPHVGIREYVQKLSEEYTEIPFDPPLDDIWEEELRRLMDKFEGDES